MNVRQTIFRVVSVVIALTVTAWIACSTGATSTSTSTPTSTRASTPTSTRTSTPATQIDAPAAKSAGEMAPTRNANAKPKAGNPNTGNRVGGNRITVVPSTKAMVMPKHSLITDKGKGDDDKAIDIDTIIPSTKAFVMPTLPRAPKKEGDDGDAATQQAPAPQQAAGE